MGDPTTHRRATVPIRRSAARASSARESAARRPAPARTVVGAVLAAALLVAGALALRWGIAGATGSGPGSAAGPDPAGTAAGSPLLRGADPLARTRIDLRPGPADAVLTARGDLTRLGLDPAEPTLSPALLESGRFGKRASLPVDGKIYAQPLFVPSLAVGGTRHDVVIVATEHDSVYAFDADATSSAAPLWHVSLLTPGARTFQAATDRVAKNRLCDSITPEVGITSTPVIDWSTQSLYVMALDVEHGTLAYRLHALDLDTGRDKQPAAIVSASVPGQGLDSRGGTVAFAATEEQQRMALTEVRGVIYAGFASWCGWNPYHGWVLGYSAASLARTVVYNTSPDQWGGGLWESQAGISADGHGHLFLVTGNGPFDLDRGGADAGDSVLEMTVQDGTLRIVDSFTPFDQLCRVRHDQDLGSGSPLMIPGRDELVLSSKTGAVYLLSESALGGYHSVANPCAAATRARTDVDRIKQELTVNTVPGGMWGTWAFWSSAQGGESSAPTDYIYGSGAQGRLTQWRLAADGTIVPQPVAQAPLPFAYPGAIPVVSSDGTTPGSGIVWTVDQTHGGVLRAFDAANIARPLWDSARNPARDGLRPGEFDHFTVPTTARGLVFVGDQGQLEVYGALPG
jgi:hypothetical protein